MRMRKKAPVLRSIPSPTRRVGPASPSPLRLAPASQQGPAGPQARRCGGRSGKNRRRQAPNQGSRQVDLSAPLIPLTLRAMNLARLLRPRGAALPVASLLSVLAVLALACSPALAHAEEATGPQYESEIPTVPTEESSPGGGGHHSGGGTGGGENASMSNKPGEHGAGGGGPNAGGGSHTGQGNQASPGSGGQPGSGSKDAGGAIGEAKPFVNPGENTASAEEDSSSSPLVPILIAIAILAAISIGAYYYRQRRQGAGSSVSPKAS